MLSVEKLIGKRSFMRTKHLCVLIHIRPKGEVGTVKHVKPSSEVFADRSKMESLLWILFNIYFSCLSVSCCLVSSLQPCDHLL